MLETQLEYADKPLQLLKQVTLSGIPAEICNESIVPWVQSFISRSYMPILRKFTLIPSKDPAVDREATINAKMFAREDLEIQIL